MKHIVAATLAVASGAFAAHAGPASPDIAAPAYFNWSGFYTGVNLGIGVAQIPTTFTWHPSGDYVQFIDGRSAAYWGGQLGYNFQSGPWMVGVEADLQDVIGAHQSSSCTNCSVTGRNLSWFGSARARVGYGAGPVLSYVTGGLAYGGVQAVQAIVTNGNSVTYVNTTPVKVGWTLGGGVEASLGGNWTGKVEYLYLDLGSMTENFSPPGMSAHVTSTVHEQIFRIGANYLWGSKPVVEVQNADWRGFYLGGNLGAGLAPDRYRQAIPTVSNPNWASSFFAEPWGLVGGIQAGHNWQAANWVLGVEADFQGTLQRENWTCYFSCSVRDTQELPWFGTVRGRLGYDVGKTLFYATGGLAYGQLQTTIATTGSPDQSFTHTGIGWTAGGGIEFPLGRNWTAKAEYLYIDLGSATQPTTYSTPPAGLYMFDQVGSSYTTQIRDHVFRTGLNYHLSPVADVP